MTDDEVTKHIFGHARFMMKIYKEGKLNPINEKTCEAILTETENLIQLLKVERGKRKYQRIRDLYTREIKQLDKTINLYLDNISKIMEEDKKQANQHAK